jgi:hypothetical protein
MEIQQSSSKEQILSAFQRLLSERKHIASRIATKQEAAEREEDKQVVEKASTYTIESIVKGLADLQLNFGSAVEQLTAQLAVEAPKLQELQRAIRVETQHAKELRDIRIAADALDILIQEHRERMKAFETKSEQERLALEREIIQQRQEWEKEQIDFDAALKARQDLQKKEREQQEADYRYELERQHKIEADEYAGRKMLLEREIAEEGARKVSDWAAREKLLAEQQATVQQYKIQVESYPQELEKAIQKNRDESIREMNEAARGQAELFEKEQEADKEVAQLKIASLQATIDTQSVQLEQLSQQLQVSLKQVQELAARAVGNTGNVEGRVS